MAIALIVLAAGKGTRMKSDLPKVLHPLGNAPLLNHALASGLSQSPDRTVVVTGHGAELVERAARSIATGAEFAHQDQQLGTGHAVLCAKPLLDDYEGDLLVLYGDTPFIRPETLGKMIEARDAGADLVVLGFHAAVPGRYGRLIADGDRLQRIVEFKDATKEEAAVDLCNSGVLLGSAPQVFQLLGKVDASETTGEIYLTDLAELIAQDGGTARVVTCDEAETLGVDSRADLAAAEILFQASMRQRLADQGVNMQAPETVYFSHDTHIEPNVIVEPYVVFGPGVTVASGAHIKAFSHLEGAQVSSGAVVGPYARLRPGAKLADGAKVGNFVEIKNANINEGAKVNHLSYVGDASVGKDSNIGAGTITCNYDGVSKHRTEIGENVFVGSNTMLIAPVTLGDASMTASGSVISDDVAPGALAIARTKQTEKPGLAVKLMQRLRALKAQKLR